MDKKESKEILEMVLSTNLRGIKRERLLNFLKSCSVENQLKLHRILKMNQILDENIGKYSFEIREFVEESGLAE